MITGKIKSQIDAIWDSFWTGGISNSIDVLEQMQYEAPEVILGRISTLQDEISAAINEFKTKYLGK